VKRAIVSVINDLNTDQRVHRTCMVLHNMGFKVVLVGRRQRRSKRMEERLYRTRRMPLLFEKGILFYAFFNIRLFFFLLFHRADVLVANDLDTLWPNYLAAKLKRAKLVYDTHEIFCEVPELQHSPRKKDFWKKIERRIFPKLKYVFTVNQSIAEHYHNEYKVDVKVVRNIPASGVITMKPVLQNILPMHKPDHPHVKNMGNDDETVIRIQKESRGLPGDKKIIILQGAGINIQRGAEEAVQSMQWVDNAFLLIIGGGDVLSVLKRMVVEHKLEQKVKFVDKLPYHELIRYTRLADVGLTIDKDTNINYRYSLPNKIFDYIHAGIAVLASPLVEVKKIVEEYKVGALITSHDPKHIAEKLNEMLKDEAKLKTWKQNAKIAAVKLSWENEKLVLEEVFRKFL
jgi:glycosyltransferase involved in cell wall biosynthesis